MELFTPHPLLLTCCVPPCLISSTLSCTLQGTIPHIIWLPGHRLLCTARANAILHGLLGRVALRLSCVVLKAVLLHIDGHACQDRVPDIWEYVWVLAS